MLYALIIVWEDQNAGICICQAVFVRLQDVQFTGNLYLVVHSSIFLSFFSLSLSVLKL
jgi:hypothetical protein